MMIGMNHGVPAGTITLRGDVTKRFDDCGVGEKVKLTIDAEIVEIYKSEGTHPRVEFRIAKLDNKKIPKSLDEIMATKMM